MVLLSGEEAHHAATAFRLAPGEVIDVVNGAGLRATGTVAAVAANRVEVAVERVVAEARPVRAITLVQALAKHKRDEQAVSQAVELGVDRIIPWQADRSVVRWPPAKAEAGQTRWASLAKSAAKVARRAYLPPVEAMVTTAQLISQLAVIQPTDQTSVRQGTGHGLNRSASQAVVVLHEAASQSLPAWYARWSGQAESSAGIVLVVGPEGGITDAEVATFETTLGAAVVSLGANVLRSSTAGPAALAALSALTGRW